MTELFVSHYAKRNQIAPEDATLSLIIVSVVLLAASVLSLKQKTCITDNSFLRKDSGDSLRGFAILLLIFGHFTFHCVKHKYFFENGGAWAVIIFLYISGVAVSKTYGIENLNKVFLLKRVKRLLIPTWLSLIAFYSLEYILLENIQSPHKVFFNFLGIMTPGRPNDSMWFVTYILYFYGVFYVSSKMRTSPVIKILIMLSVSYIIAISILKFSQLISFRIWVYYILVFPISVIIGIYSKDVKHLLGRIFKYPFLFWATMACLAYMTFPGSEIQWLKEILYPWVPYPLVRTLHPVIFVLLLTMLIFLLDKSSLNSGFLQWLGKYSFELYLIHLPFMLYYDFLLFRKPLFVFLFLYLTIVMLLSYVLKNIADQFNRILFGNYLQSDNRSE